MTTKQRKTKVMPYHSEELRWEETDCSSNSMHNEDIVDPWLEQDTEREVKIIKSNFSFEQVQKSSPSHIEDESPETASDEEEISENVTEKDADLFLDDFPSDEFPTEENLDSLDSNNGDSDGLEDIDLPDLDEDAQQSPWDITSSKTDSSSRVARGKSSAISDMLEVKNPAEQSAAVEYLTEIFLMHPHPATFSAFKNMAMKGLSFTDIKTIIDLRHAWMERPGWWLRRYKGEITRIPQGHNSLSWKLAQRICQAQWEFPPDAMIEEAWLEEWLHLKPEIDCMKYVPRGYYNFPSFIEEKVNCKYEEFLYDGLQMQTIFNREVESIDAPTWRRQYPNYQDTCHDNYIVKRIHQPPSKNPGE